MSGQDCTLAWCQVDHDKPYDNKWTHHMGRVWHFDTDQIAVALWAGCEERGSTPILYLRVTNAESPEEVVQNVTLTELQGLVALLSVAARDAAFTFDWAREARSLNLA